MCRDRKTWGECVNDDKELLALQPEWAIFRNMGRDFISGKRLTLAKHAKNRHFKINYDDERSCL